MPILPVRPSTKLANDYRQNVHKKLGSFNILAAYVKKEPLIPEFEKIILKEQTEFIL